MHRGPSQHLSWDELACKDGTPYPMIWRQDRAVFLARLFESIRVACGGFPITVVSGYRTYDWNVKIKGAENSQHMEGRALDLRPPHKLTVAQFYNIIRALPAACGLGGLGRYPTFVHIDTRPHKFVVTWSGGGLRDDRPTNRNS